MDFQLSEEHRLIQETARRIAREKIAPRAAEIDETQEYPHDIFEAFRDTGLTGLTIPKEYGGSGAGMLALALAVEEAAEVELVHAPDVGSEDDGKGLQQGRLARAVVTDQEVELIGERELLVLEAAEVLDLDLTDPHQCLGVAIPPPPGYRKVTWQNPSVDTSDRRRGEASVGPGSVSLVRRAFGLWTPKPQPA